MAEDVVQDNFFCSGILPDRNLRFVLARNLFLVRDEAGRQKTAPQASALIGETMLGAFFLAGRAGKTEEFTVSLQLEGKGPMYRLIAFSSASGGCRVYIARPEARWDGPDGAGIGKGILRVNRWKNGASKKVYSSVVPFTGDDLQGNLDSYLSQSEQVDGLLQLESTWNHEGVTECCGLYFDPLPQASTADLKSVENMIGELSPAEYIRRFLHPDQKVKDGLRPLAARESVRVLKTGHFFSSCDCNDDRIKGMLTLLGEEAIREILDKEGLIEVYCEFCKKRYAYHEEEIEALWMK